MEVKVETKEVGDRKYTIIKAKIDREVIIFPDPKMLKDMKQKKISEILGGEVVVGEMKKDAYQKLIWEYTPKVNGIFEILGEIKKITEKIDNYRVRNIIDELKVNEMKRALEKKKRILSEYVEDLRSLLYVRVR